MTDTERTERLEKLYEKAYHEVDLINRTLDSLEPVLINMSSLLNRTISWIIDNHGRTRRDATIIRDLYRQVDRDLQGHLKTHYGRKDGDMYV